MATAREELRDLIAAAAYETAKQWGEPITVYTYAQSGGASVYSIVSNYNAVPLIDGGSLTEVRSASFAIPIQSGFADTSNETDPVQLQDRIRFRSRDYYVTQIIPESWRAVWKIEAEENKRLFQGID
jgi:hypothetical protein